MVGTPPTDDGTTLVGRELDIIGGSLVSDVSSGKTAGGDANTDDWVRGDITQPDRLVVNLINNGLRIHTTTSDTVFYKFVKIKFNQKLRRKWRRERQDKFNGQERQPRMVRNKVSYMFEAI